MGHVEPGGETSGPEAEGLTNGRWRTLWRPGGLAHPVWSLWWGLKREFALWSAPRDWFSTPGSWTYFGNDFVTGLRRNGSTGRAFDLLDANPELFEPVKALAALNLRRHEQMFHLIAILYVSVPVTFVLGLAEVMPDELVLAFKADSFIFLYLAAILTVCALVYMIGLWRARQVVSVIELWGIERGTLGI